MDKRNEIQDFLKKEISTILHLEEAVVDENSSLDALGINSMSFVELLIAIENKYGVQLINSGIKNADLKNLKTLSAKIEQEL